MCPKGHWLIRAMRGTGKAAPVALHGEGGYSLSRKRVSPLNPREKGRGAFPLDPAALAVLGLKSYAACGIWCGVRGFATGPYVSSPLATAPYYREARVTIARRRTACWRHCCARRGWDRCFSISTAFFSVSCPQLLEYAPDSCEIWQK